jgi:tRNA(Ile)-lysidine synthase
MMTRTRRTRLQAAFEAALRAPGAPAAGSTVVAAVSGGPDSVSLLDVLSRLAAGTHLKVVAAHLDHRLREASAEDAAFCRALADHLGVPLRVGSADVRALAGREKSGLEDAARRARYAFLRSVAAETGASAIVLAHTRDDQAETVLLRLLRGAGSRGLSAMRARAGDLWRPLLGASRADVLAHLSAHGLSWREDPTNADPVHRRNRIRHELIPYLEARFNPRVREALARSAALLAEEASFVEDQAAALLARARKPGDAVVLSRDALRSAPRAVARAAVRAALAEAGGGRGLTQGHVDRVLKLASSPRPSGRRLVLPNGCEASFSFDDVRLGRIRPAVPAYAVPLAVPGRVELPGGFALSAQAARGPAVSKGETAVVAVPAGPLVVRTRRPGDRVSSGGRVVSLKRALIEDRVPADLRAALPLLASGSHVLWFPGQESRPAFVGAERFVRVRLQKARAASRREPR